MIFNLFSSWRYADGTFGCAILEFIKDDGSDDLTGYSLLGFSYCKAIKQLQFDFFWKIFEVNFS